MRDADAIVTEDEDSGYEYYKTYFGSKVSSSKGNSNLSKYGSDNTLLIGDGCAIGAYIQDLLLTGADLYLPESFEYTLLQKDMFSRVAEVQQSIRYPEEMIGTGYASPERYYTALLSQITQNTPARYSKTSLNECYVKDCCCKGTRCEFFTREKKLPEIPGKIQ